MYIKLCPKLYQFLFCCLLGAGLGACTTRQNEADISLPQATRTPVPVEAAFTPLTPTLAIPATILPTEDSEEATATAVPTPTATKIITTPTLINIEIPLETESLPAYGWFSEDSQVAHFAYPEQGVSFSYDISTQQLISTTLSQMSEDEIIEQITPNLPPDARVVAISPRYQNVLFTIPISQPMTLERGAFNVPLGDELWLYREGGSTRLGAIDECFQLHLTNDILWSLSEDLATVFAASPMACAWSNWLVDLEMLSVGPLNPTWEEGAGLPDYYVAAILPNKQLLVIPLLRDKPSAILDLQTQELTVLSNRGNEIAKYLDETVLLDFVVWPGDRREETEVGFSPLNETDRQLMDTIEGWIRTKYVSPDQKHVLLFSGSPDYYGLFENQETSGIWLLTFP